MKRVYTLFIAIIIVISAMGQPSKNSHRYEGQRGEVFNILNQITGNNENLANPVFAPNASKQVMDSLIFEEFYEFNGGWRNSEKDEYLWDESGKLILQTHSGWEVENNIWYPYQKTYHYYDAYGRLLNMDMQYRDFTITGWIDWEKTTLTYQGDIGVTAIKSFWQPELNQWIISNRYEYVFDNDGKILEITFYYNDEEPVNWLEGEKYEYFYDGNGEMIQELWSIWDTDYGDWWNVYKVDYSYEDNGNLIMELWNYWNYSTQVWENESKCVFTYDVQGNISECLESWWEFSIQDWLVEEKINYTYNNDYTNSDLILPPINIGYFSLLNEFLFNHMLLTAEIFEAWDETYDEDSRTNYYYSENNTSGVELNNNNDLLIYPNPSTNYFIIDLKNGSQTVLVEIYNTHGRIVASQEFIENQPISVRDLNKGLYFYKFIYQNNTFCGKILVQ